MGISDAPNDQIMRALKFNIKDLDTNRHGLLAKGQHKRVRQWQFGWSVGIAVVTLIIVGVLAVSIFPLFVSPQFWALSMILPVALGLFWFQQRTLRILARGKVTSIHGRAIVYQDSRSYIIDIRDKPFRLEGKVADEFVSGETYTLYYLPGLDYLLTAEHHVTHTSSHVMKGLRPHSMQKRTEPIERRPEQRLKWRGKEAIEVHEDRHTRLSKVNRAPASPVRDVRPQLKNRAKEHKGR